MKLCKRRKSIDNPYTILYSQANDKYYINFKDVEKNVHCIEISLEIFFLFNKFELEDISYLNKYDRHLEHSHLSEFTLNKRAIKKLYCTEELAISKLVNEDIYKALIKLPIKQYRRIILFYFYNLRQNQIAKLENCSIRAVQYSLNIALKNLRKFLK